MNKKQIFLISLSSIFFLIGGYFIGGSGLINSNTLTKEKHQGNNEFTNPLLECGMKRTNTFFINNLQRNVNKIINRNKDNNNITHASVYYHNLKNGSWFGINEKENFSPASLLKVPLMMTFLKQAEKNPEIMSKSIKIEGEIEKVLSQSFVPLKSVESGKSYTIEELIYYMINYSDNKAANALLSANEPEVFEQIYKDMSIPVPSLNSPENYMPVTQYSSFFEVLYNASYLNQEMSEKALKILANPGFQRGITAGLPIGIPVSHKFGERRVDNYNQLHDCGIVYKKDSPYLLCIMTRGEDFLKMAETIKEISREIYNSQE